MQKKHGVFFGVRCSGETKNDDDEEEEMEMEMKMKMKRRRRERERETERREGRKNRGETERQNTDMDAKHLCSCANHFRDRKRLLLPRSKQALSRRFQFPSTHKQIAQRLDFFGPCFKTGRTRPEKKACT